MKTAEITKEVTLVGEGDYVEIWDTEKFTNTLVWNRKMMGLMMLISILSRVKWKRNEQRRRISQTGVVK
jgi:hypothetical protein